MANPSTVADSSPASSPASSRTDRPAASGPTAPAGASPSDPTVVEAAAPVATGFRRIGAALTYRDFRVMWTGAFVSTIGTWMQQAAENWLVLTLTGVASAFYLGLNSTLSQLPILLFTLIGGVIADRRDRRQLLLTSQYVQMTAAFILAGLVYFDAVRIWHVLSLSVITGLAQAFGGPAHQSLLPSLVDKKDMPNAVAFNSIQFNLARVIGPLLAGAALSAFGMVACFGLNGLSFIAVIIAILSLRIRHIPSTATTRLHQELKGGLQYVRDRPSLIGLAVLGFVTTFLGNPLLTFLSLFARDVFHGGVDQYTYLLASAGGGAVAGAVIVAWLGKYRHMGRTALILQIAYGACVVIFAATRILWLSTIVLFTAGICMVMVTSTLLSLVQLNAPNEMRGRVMSIFMVAFRGGMTFGGFAGGWIATRTSAPLVLSVNGVLLAFVAVWFLFKSHGVREL